MKIAIDTNIFIYAARFRIDLISQLKGNELFVPESVARELEKMGYGKTKNAKASSLALAVLKKRLKDKKIRLIISETIKNADNELIELGKHGYAIVTHDRELIKNLKAAGCSFGYIRQKKYFVFEGKAYKH